MITCVLYSESGGTYKTTMTANLAVAFERMGLDTLVIDLDSQDANLTTLMGAGEARSDSSADNIVKHILEMPDGDFSDLIETTDEGVDVVPSHGMLSSFTSKLEQKITYESGMKDISRDEYPRYELLYKLLWERERLNEQYDVILIDPNARAEDLLFNAIYALRTIIAPVKPAGKGSLSLDGLNELATNLENQLGIQVGLSCVVPCEVGQNNAHSAYLNKFANESFSIPATIGKRESMMDAMWEANGSAFKVIEERWKTEKEGDEVVASLPGRRRVYDREVDTLINILKIAKFVATETFDEEVELQQIIDIDDHEPRKVDLSDPLSEEVTPS